MKAPAPDGGLPARAGLPFVAAALLCLSGCGLFGGRDVAERRPMPDWRSVATQGDRQRMQGWRALWQDAVRIAYRHGFAADIGRDGLLLDPDAGAAEPAPPSGAYRCRMVRLGGSPAYQSLPTVSCRIAAAGDRLSFSMVEGAQRPSGHIYPSQAGRPVFLGTMSLSDERRAPAYGSDSARDMIGYLEALPSGKWRLALPQSHWGAMIDVVELRPAR